MTVKITQNDENISLTLIKVEGKLTATDAGTLTQVLAGLTGNKKVLVDLSGVTFIDGAAAASVKAIEQSGIRLVGVDFFVRSVIDTHSNGQ